MESNYNSTSPRKTGLKIVLDIFHTLFKFVIYFW